MLSVTANLPTTLSKSQVSSVRKNLKVRVKFFTLHAVNSVLLETPLTLLKDTYTLDHDYHPFYVCFKLVWCYKGPVKSKYSCEATEPHVL